MKNLKLNYRIHLALYWLCWLFEIVGATEAAVFLWCGSLLWAYPLAILVANIWLTRRIESHCYTYRKLLALLPIIEAAKTIPFPQPVPLRHRNIRHVKQWKVKKY